MNRGAQIEELRQLLPAAVAAVQRVLFAPARYLDRYMVTIDERPACETPRQGIVIRPETAEALIALRHDAAVNARTAQGALRDLLHQLTHRVGYPDPCFWIEVEHGPDLSAAARALEEGCTAIAADRHLAGFAYACGFRVDFSGHTAQDTRHTAERRLVADLAADLYRRAGFADAEEMIAALNRRYGGKDKARFLAGRLLQFDPGMAQMNIPRVQTALSNGILEAVEERMLATGSAPKLTPAPQWSTVGADVIEASRSL